MKKTKYVAMINEVTSACLYKYTVFDDLLLLTLQNFCLFASLCSLRLAKLVNWTICGKKKETTPKTLGLQENTIYNLQGF